MVKRFVLIILLLLGITTALASSCGGGGGDKEKPQNNPVVPIPIPDDGQLPAPPRNVFAIPGDRSVAITWDRVFSAVGYRIYQSTDGVTFIRLTSSVNITETNAVVGNLVNGRVYYYGVTAVDERNNESGISYIGGAPTAKPIIPAEPPPEDPTPAAPENFSYLAGDRELMLFWGPDPAPGQTTMPEPPVKLQNYFLERSVSINPNANVPGANRAEKDKVIQAYKDALFMQKDLPLSLVYDNSRIGHMVEGFSTNVIPARPFYIDEGAFPLGLPPNYLPFGLSQGDVSYSYKLGAVNQARTTFANILTGVVPKDDPPFAPVLQFVFLTPKASGTGVGVLVQWLQPKPPFNSDLKNYILSRYEGSTSIGLVVQHPWDRTTESISYQDDSVVAGKTYRYQVFAQDYSAQISEGSSILQVAIPGGGGANQPPVAKLVTIPSPAVIAINGNIQFDATTSSDPDGTIILYEFDFDWDKNDATFMADVINTTGICSSTQASSPPYTVAKTYYAGVRVTDNEGAKKTTFVTISVTAGP